MTSSQPSPIAHKTNQTSKPMQLILASASPRRRELLARLVPDFEVLASDIPEIFDLSLPDMGSQVADLARQKALAIALQQAPGALVLGADTVVCLDQEMLGKPQHADDAEHMLARLSGRWHEVITGVALIPSAAPTQLVWLDWAVSRVQMRELTQAERKAYVATGEPLDKAGAYAIQGGAAGFVEQVIGSYENIVGLPLELTQILLEKAQFPHLKSA